MLNARGKLETVETVNESLSSVHHHPAEAVCELEGLITKAGRTKLCQRVSIDVSDKGMSNVFNAGCNLWSDPRYTSRVPANRAHHPRPLWLGPRLRANIPS